MKQLKEFALACLLGLAMGVGLSLLFIYRTGWY